MYNLISHVEVDRKTLMKVRRRGLIPLGLVLVLAGAGVADLPPLIEAAKGGDWEAVGVLLEQGTDVTVTAADGATALHWASYWDDVETAQLLIRAGADVSAANDIDRKKMAPISRPPGIEAKRAVRWTKVSPEEPASTAARPSAVVSDMAKMVPSTATPAISETELLPRPVRKALSAMSSFFFIATA